MSISLDEDGFRIVVEHCIDAVALLQSDGKASYVSPPVAQFLGYTPAEFVAFDAFQIVHPDDRPDAAARFTELLKQPGGSQTVVNRVRHKDGSWRWIETLSTNQLEVPKVGAVISSFRDITDRKRAEKTFRDAEEKLRFIVESATEFAIFTTDLDGLVSSWNSGATRIFGYDEREIIGQDCRMLFTPEDNARDKPESEMHDALVRGHGNDERWHVRKDGSRFWGSGMMMPLCDDAGTIHGYLKICRDMTREKRAADALREADRRKDEFIAILAHELRNPLASISNAAQLLRISDNESYSEWCQQVIERQSGHMARLLDGLLDISRITLGKIQLRKERLDLSGIILRSVELLRPLIQQKKQRLTLANSPREMPIIGDATRIEQVVVNLLTNAINFTDEGGHISVTAQRDDREAVVTVEDTGIGIPPEMHTRIFELFAQVDRSIDRSQGGLGIGLTLAQTLIELHGGRICVESNGLSQGSKFTITLPVADDQELPDGG